MTGRWSGRRVTTTLRRILNRDNGTCWLCHHPGANSIDHVIPRHTRPDLMWTDTNMRAAHLARAGQPRGCQTPGCRCIGNSSRGTTPATAPPSRPW